MSYRDDLEAAMARAEAAEQRSRRLEKVLLDLQNQRPAAAADDAATAAMVAVPDRFEVTQTEAELRVSWSWFRFSLHVPMLCFCVMWDAAIFAVYLGALRAPTLSWIALVFPIAHLAVGLGLTYATLAGLLNRTTVVAAADGLEIQHGPVPWPGPGKLPRKALRQLYVTCNSSSKTRTWDLCALGADDQQVRLLPRLEHADQAFYLERQLELQLGIHDRPVHGEAERPSAT